MMWIIDACSFINLIHLEHEEFLFNKILNLNPLVIDAVFDEIKKNVYKGNTIEKNEKEVIERKLTYLRRLIFKSSDISDLDKNFFDKVEKFSGYKKRNGEFYSVVLCTFYNRMYSTKILFITDDNSAAEFFKDFFIFHQIGYIEDTVDLLLFLYGTNTDVSKKNLNDYLSNLFSNYALGIKNLFNLLNSLQSNLPKQWLKDRFIKEQVYQCIKSLNNGDYSKLEKIYKSVRHKSKYEKLKKILESNKEVFEIANEKNNILDKINLWKENLKNADLLKLT